MSNDFNFLKENIDIIILNALYGGDKYGYEISKEILEKTNSQYEIKQPTLYSYLKRLESRDLITSYWGAESNGGRRRYYTLTDSGKIFCEQTSMSWQTRKNLMDNLVIDNIEGIDHGKDTSEALDIVTNFDNVRPTKRSINRKSKDVSQEIVTEQDNLSRELEKLIKNAPQDPKREDKPVNKPSQTSLFEQYILDEDDKETSSSNQENDDVTSEYVLNREDTFNVVQDNADDFIEKFDKAAEQITTSQPHESNVIENEDYRRTLNSILSDQMDAMQKFNTEQPEPNEFAYINDRPLALEEVANNLAKDGIRMRIYSSTTATYRTKELFPLKKAYCLTAWFASLSVIVLLMLAMLATLSLDVWRSFVVTSAAVLLVPIVFTFVSLADPTRKDKPQINFRALIIGTSIASIVIILLSFGVNILFNLLVFSNVGAVATQIGIPSILSLILPLTVLFLNILFKKLSK